MSPIAYPQTDYFLMGFIGACSFVAAVFFVRFWKETRDALFLAFATFFLIQVFLYVFGLSLSHPNEGNSVLRLLRLISVLVVLGAILKKNIGRE